MTHEYTLLVGATVLPGGTAPACEALAWADGVVLALGSEGDVRSISRGDSHVLELRGAFVVPAGATLEVGGPADIDVLDHDPRDHRADAPRRIARIRGGHLAAER